MDGSDQGPGAARVCIVEDEDNIALALDTVFAREGWQLTRHADGAAALAAIRAAPPDLVVLDVMLPGVSGYEICQQMRLDPALSATRILMMTARGNAVERRKGLALGADGFIAKPFDLRDLIGQARRLLEAGPRSVGGAGRDVARGPEIAGAEAAAGEAPKDA